ncbi:Ultraviolet-B receptor UVR8 [Acorus calamus]|uniref:Ultraviolet-B receptor UVR8 n=1 Tax=Acorus calamus TaxID=4465 RepID=A0AAV9DIY3_ACOCL|nr:Ultraviolet-B receptor UVR8 [Acorus calamus]
MWKSRVLQATKAGVKRLSGGSAGSGSPSGGGHRFAALWGNGDYGRLGIGRLESKWRPTVCPYFGVDDDPPLSVACGGAHTLFLTEKGHVYASGLNDFGQLGFVSEEGYTLEPVLLSELPENIIRISAGYRHSSALTDDGVLYMWGNNSSGQLGFGRTAEKVVSIPSKVDSLVGIHVKDIALGSEHSIAITDEGDVLSWGAGGSGRLGHGHQSSFLGFLGSSSEFSPRIIKNFDTVKVKKIAAGLLNSACIDEHGSVFIFGEKTTDKLHFGESKNATLPSLINEIPIAEEVACGGYHTCVLTSDRELYTWGSNENGCLGHSGIDAIRMPQRVEGQLLNLPISEVSCGWKHTAAISGGNVFTWGWGGSYGTFYEEVLSSGGQLGQGDEVDYFEPRVVHLGDSVKALQISCGFNHTGGIFQYVESEEDV